MYQYRLPEGTAGTSRRYIRGEDDGQGVEVYEVSPQALAEELPGWCYPLCSSGAAAIAAVATHPIDVVKTNMQVAASLKVGIEHDRRLLARLDTHCVRLPGRTTVGVGDRAAAVEDRRRVLQGDGGANADDGCGNGSELVDIRAGQEANESPWRLSTRRVDLCGSFDSCSSVGS